ncbi:hypothetical protein V6Z12_A07G072200 [Gossypium hirsutum]|uniref:Rhodanese-like domain-containing protein 8, chloroplastic isoform X2 n=1 Tax=Gossypium hirsutum TaxID=3635 RepID=A0A1U8LI69_GOSHI|nr:rhodanese-like domain-containing protein 8, chloroplastic isoform X2 [Gossypium hirsutum]
MGGWSVHSVSTPLSLSLGSHSLPKPAYYCCFNYGFPVKSRKAPFCAISIRCCASASKSYNVNKILQAEPEIDDFVVVNFYRFVFIKDPQHEIAKHLTFLKGLDIHGRIYINEQGINAQYSGPSKHSFAYVEWLKEDDRFSDILVQTSPAFNRHAFPKLKLRYKPSLVQGVASDQLLQVDKEKTDILMYCTGGIRCDVYSTILRQQGFQNLYTLEGGVSHYLKTEGPVKWIGNLFTFDSRLSLPPSAYNNETMIEASMTQQAFDSDKFAKCYVCNSQVSELRHRNCANLDCNFLFLCCENCVMDLRGCCCYNCMTAPRRRPVLPGFQRYRKWHVYRDQKVEA